MLFKKTIVKTYKIKRDISSIPRILTDFNYLGYHGKHIRMRASLKKPCICICGKRPPDDLHNLSGEYTQALTDWIWLCRKCHARFHAQKPYFPKEIDITDMETLKNVLGIK